MSAITVRQLPEGIKQRLRLRAAANGRSMEAEARAILVETLDRPARIDLTWIGQLMALADEVGGVDLPLPDDTAATAADLSDLT